MTSLINTNSTFSQAVRSLAKDSSDKENSPIGKQVAEHAQTNNAQKIYPSSAAINKKQLNAAILQSTLQFNETIADKPSALLLKTALQGINEALKKMGVDTSVEDTYEQSDIDFSPEATADRIVSFSTQFFGSYQKQHPEMDDKEAMRSFVGIISGGIGQGFSEARQVLGGLNVLQGKIADNIDKTYQIVEQGLQAFANREERDQARPETE